MNRLLIAAAGLLAGTAFGFALLVLAYTLYSAISGYRGDFGMGFGLVIAPLGGLLIGIALATWLALGRVRRPALVVGGTFLGVVAIYVLATLV